MSFVSRLKHFCAVGHGTLAVILGGQFLRKMTTTDCHPDDPIYGSILLVE